MSAEELQEGGADTGVVVHSYTLMPVDSRRQHSPNFSFLEAVRTGQGQVLPPVSGSLLMQHGKRNFHNIPSHAFNIGMKVLC